MLADCAQYWCDRKAFEKENNDARTPIFTDPKNHAKLKVCLESLDSDTQIQSLLNPEGLLEQPIIGNE